MRKTITTSAIALGVLAGSAGIASALSSTSPADQSTPAAANAESDRIQEPTLDGSIKSAEVEGQSEAEESSALTALATISSDEAAASALAANPGATVNGVELGNENGTVVYEVDLTDASGAALEVKIDAGTAAVLAQESGDENESDASATEEAEGDEGTETDGIDHQFEGAETGNNGDGVADADDANEADEAPDTTPAN